MPMTRIMADAISELTLGDGCLVYVPSLVLFAEYQRYSSLAIRRARIILFKEIGDWYIVQELYIYIYMLVVWLSEDVYINE